MVSASREIEAGTGRIFELIADPAARLWLNGPDRRPSTTGVPGKARPAHALRRRADEVPFVAGDVEEHRDVAVGFGARCREELHARGRHPGMRRAEILDVEEETHSAGRLPPGDGGLVFAVSPRQQQAGRGAWRPDYHPPLGPALVRQGRGVLHELEAEHVHEEADSRVVLADHEGDEAEMHAASIRAAPAGDAPGPFGKNPW